MRTESCARASLVLAASIAAMLVTAGAPALANTAQDQLGVGARAKAMGGAGTAIATDTSATYYNPAGLSHCDENQISLDVNHLVYALDTESDSDAAKPSSLKDRTALSIATCHHLPLGLSLGIAVDTGLQRALRMDQRSLEAVPIFALYGSQLETVSMMTALSYKISDKLSIGMGGSILANSSLGVGVDVPVISADQELAASIVWEFDPTASFHAGVLYEITPQLRAGAALRTPLFHKLEGEVTTTVDVAGVLLDVDILIESVAWYSPLQAAVGAAYDLGPSTLLSADLTWYRWSAYPGPALRISPLDPADSIAAGLLYPPEEKIDFKDVFVPRLGAEHWLSKKLALRAGLSYRPSPAPLPSAEERGNLLDSDLSIASVGFGYEWKSSAGAKGRSATSARVDFHARVQHMAERAVVKTLPDESTLRYTFGGQLYDAGLSLRLGW